MDELFEDLFQEEFLEQEEGLEVFSKNDLDFVNFEFEEDDGDVLCEARNDDLQGGRLEEECMDVAVLDTDNNCYTNERGLYIAYLCTLYTVFMISLLCV